MKSDAPRMPDAVENNSFIPTLDRHGAIWLYTNAITQAYLDFAGQTKGTLLEVAAGYGHIVIKTLQSGARKVFANEIAAAIGLGNEVRLDNPRSWRFRIVDFRSRL
jgi:hypothetical protein